jgi:glycosyltransferase involved in cell wall biosynthesis
MHICFFTENHYKGGLDTFIINLLNAWPDSNDILTLVCNDSHPGLNTIKEKIDRLIVFKKYSRVFTSKIAQGQDSLKYSQSYIVRAFFVLAYRVLQYPILFPWYTFSLTLFFYRSDFDRLMVINGGYPASLLCRCAMVAWRLSGKQSQATFNFHNSAIKPPWYFSFPEYLIDRAVAWSAGHIISVSKNCLNTLNNRKAFVNNTKLRYIYNGIADPAIVKNKEKSSSLKLDSVTSYCLMLATYEPRKGYDYLLHAFKIVVKEIPEASLQIYGYGKDHEKQRIINTIKRLNLQNNVSLNDFAPDVASLLTNASVLVVPSQAYESFGLTIIEAMAFGVPVVTTDVGGMPEVLEDSNAGYVCSKNDSIKFANSIVNILADQDLASELGRNGRKTFEERFVALNMSKQYESIIKG